jgi:hypothetical protein
MSEADPCTVAGLEPLNRRQAGKIDGGSRPRDCLQFRQRLQRRCQQGQQYERQHADAAQSPFQEAHGTADQEF